MSDRKILVIDDEAQIRELVGDILVSRGFTSVTSVATGKAGIETAASIKPDLVLLDLTLADMPGEEVQAAILRANPAARFLIVTGHMLDIGRDSADASVRGILQKPFSPQELFKAIDKAMGAS